MIDLVCRPWRVAAMVAVIGTLLGGGGTALADAAPPRPAHIHRGTCDAIEPTPAFDLADLIMPSGADEDAADDRSVHPAAMSVTTLDVPLADLLAGGYVVNVHESEEELGEELACGAITGEPRPDGLAVGLASHGARAEFNGIAWLRPEGEQTTVSLFLTETERPAAAARVEPVAVEVTLGGQAGEFTVVADRTTFKVGVPYRFIVTNAGQVPHEFMIVPRMPPDGMPIEEMGGLGAQEMMEAVHHLALAEIEEEDLPAGTRQDAEVTFDEPATMGTFELACYVPGHYEAGMHIPIEVVP